MQQPNGSAVVGDARVEGGLAASEETTVVVVAIVVMGCSRCGRGGAAGRGGGRAGAGAGGGGRAHAPSSATSNCARGVRARLASACMPHSCTWLASGCASTAAKTHRRARLTLGTGAPAPLPGADVEVTTWTAMSPPSHNAPARASADTTQQAHAHRSGERVAAVPEEVVPLPWAAGDPAGEAAAVAAALPPRAGDAGCMSTACTEDRRAPAGVERRMTAAVTARRAAAATAAALTALS